MLTAIRRNVTVGPGGRIELGALGLEPGTPVYVVVLVEAPPAKRTKRSTARRGAAPGGPSGRPTEAKMA